MRIGFLFNHDAVHQISHTAPIIVDLVRRDGMAVSVLCSDDAQEQRVRALLGDASAHVLFVRLTIGRIAAALDAGLRWIAPFRRIAVLRENLATFAVLDVLVVPETTSLLLRTRFGIDALKFVWIPHGAGDRSVGFRPVAREFDLVLLSGQKVRDRMIASGIVSAERSAIVGYPKFDTVDPTVALPSLFDNDRPTVVYNPHFDPLLSSWYDMGPALIEWFAGQRRFNLIVAPHVMLFQRKLHASVEHRRIRWRRSIARYRHVPHIMIDEGSTRSVDMTYTRSADIYIGDVSSQIYEWIARPRPAIFLNAAGIDWAKDPNFAHWHLGQLMDDLGDLPAALDLAVQNPTQLHDLQHAAFQRTFSITGESAAARAGAAIIAAGRAWSDTRTGGSAPVDDRPAARLGDPA